jgi:hypothetical protein
MPRVSNERAPILRTSTPTIASSVPFTRMMSGVLLLMIKFTGRLPFSLAMAQSTKGRFGSS